MLKLIKTLSIFAVFFVFVACQTSAPVSVSVHQLIREGRIEEAKSCFDLKTNINKLDEFGNTPIHVAAQINDAQLCEFLVKKGADTSIRNFEGDTPLHSAIKFRAMESTRYLATVGNDIYAGNELEEPALLAAIRVGPEWYPVVINEGTMDKMDAEGDTLLHFLVKNRFLPCIDYVIHASLPLSLRNSQGKTSLQMAFDTAEDVASVTIAVKLIEGGSQLVGGKYAFFEKSVKLRNLMFRSPEGKTPLHFAALYNQIGIAMYIVGESSVYGKKNVVQSQDYDGRTPLHDACTGGSQQVASFLLASGAQVDAVDKEGKTPLLMTIPSASQRRMYQLLVSNRASINHKDLKGDTVLHAVTRQNSSVDILSYLVEQGAFVNERNKDGDIPLSIAVANRNRRHIEFYAGAGAQLHAQNQNGRTPFTLVLDQEKTPADTKAVVDLLSVLITSRNVLSTDSQGNNALHVAVKRNASIPVLEFIIKADPDVNARNKDGDTALLIATRKNYKDAGLLLLESGADIFTVNTKDESPLRFAFMDVQTESWILSKERLESQDGMGNRPIHYASLWKMDEALQRLIKRGVSMNARNLNGETALFSAVRADSPKTIEILVRGGTTIDANNPASRDSFGNTPLHCSVQNRSLSSIDKLCSLGISIDARNMIGKSALSSACQSQDYESCEMLLRHHADVNSTDPTGRSVLTESVIIGNRKIIELLLKNGADPSIREEDGKNSYHVAARTGNRRNIALIRDYGADPLSRDNGGESPFSSVIHEDKELALEVLGSRTDSADTDGNTPLHIAVEKGASMDLVAELIKMGFPINTLNSSGKTPLSMAVEKGDEKLELLLIFAGADFFKTTPDGECALSYALRNSREGLIEAILTSGKERIDLRGDSVLHYAARFGDVAAVKRILKSGVDRNLKNVSGETARDVALRWHRSDIATML